MKWSSRGKANHLGNFHVRKFYRMHTTSAWRSVWHRLPAMCLPAEPHALTPPAPSATSTPSACHPTRSPVPRETVATTTTAQELLQLPAPRNLPLPAPTLILTPPTTPTMCTGAPRPATTKSHSALEWSKGEVFSGVDVAPPPAIAMQMVAR